MGRKVKYSAEIKLKYVMAYKENKMSKKAIARELKIDPESISSWITNYEAFGIEGLKPSEKKIKYTEVLKESAVLEYLQGELSQQKICKKYGIRTKRALQDWIMRYNGHEKLNASGTGGVILMTKGRKTTYTERIEAVKYCLEHENNYMETAERFEVSYRQIYAWMKKYENTGVEGLIDKRGKAKEEAEMTELDKLRAQNQLLEAENRQKQMEIDFLKKLQEIERGRY